LPYRSRNDVWDYLGTQSLNAWIWQRVRCEGTRTSCVGRSTKVNIVNHDIAWIVRPVGIDSDFITVSKNTGLDKNLRLLSSVDAIRPDSLEEIVDRMNGTETDRWHSTVHIIPVVVGEGDMQLALIFGAIAICVSDKACLPLDVVCTLVRVSI
jgi:hypothetical protein